MAVTNGLTASKDKPARKHNIVIEINADDLPYEEELDRNPYSVKHWLRYIEHKKSCLKDYQQKIKEQTTKEPSTASEDQAEKLPLISKDPAEKPPSPEESAEKPPSPEESAEKDDEPAEKDVHITVEDVYHTYERAVLQMPMSYKLWNQYLKLRVSMVRASVCLASAEVEGVNNMFERCLVFMHRMPRVWLTYCKFLMDQHKITRTRKTFDRALCALPITQHKRVWSLYLQFVMKHGTTETALRVWRRYLKLCPENTEEYINYLVSQNKLAEAAERYEWCVNTDAFSSKHGKSKYQLWSELCDLISSNPQETSLKNAEAIIRHGLQRYMDQTGRLWNCLAQYYINGALFERARDVFEEALLSVVTVRDFTQVFDAYTQFEELLLSRQMQELEEANEDLHDEFNLRLARYEDLIDRRALLLNSVMLRQNPHNVIEWQKRVTLYAGKPKMVVATYMEAVKTIDPKQAAGKLWLLWVEFSRFYEDNGQLKDARVILQRGTEVAYVRVDDLASVWCEWAEMEIRNDNEKESLELLKRATALPGARISYHDEAETVQRRLHKSLKLWSLYADLEESLGTFQSCKAVYDRIVDLRIATPQIVINYGMFLQENNYFEDAFKAYEKGIALFKWPYVYDIWNTYLAKFLERYKGTKIERARDLFEQCLEKCPAKYCKSLYLLYAQMEETHGLARHALQVYSRGTKSVPPEQKMEMYNVYLQHANLMYGISRTREIYQEAIEELPDDSSREMCLRFAETERVMGEIDRAREIFVYCSQICDPRLTKDYWDRWTEFEVQHGNEDTMKELLRIKRSMEAKYNTQVNQMSAQMISSASSDPIKQPVAVADQTNTTAAAAPVDGMRMLEARAAAVAATTAPPQQGNASKIMFVRGETTVRDEEVADNARVANPDEIDIDDESDDAEDMPMEKEIPKAVYSGLR